ncbi:TPA: heme acquisition protein HasA [Yersinia enterocolitica]|uniref:heme acquisition protein HasA n=1 Tax=Yersinia enterocolitica TaxID=630 RepID=UPI0021E8B25B|nr:heme acquisition protein HasA [Yersinia enterocolitica]UYJ84981.1 heme acquisition protein HasA [Yersinia enterocolitica]UYK14358.1 heme acquisition protein HasA [Yersinia enterocolitica]HDL7929471.1 hemophore [Yersinia enterocolitica]HDL7933175.1 hemophore [Yersinia enterocolitica]HDY4896239.1 hemophore [Yersinia enterocolitica]
MTITIKYQSQLAEHSISSYIYQWTTAYGDLIQTPTSFKTYGTLSNRIDANNNEIVQAEFQSFYESNAAMIIGGGRLEQENITLMMKKNIQILEFGELLIPNTDNAGKQIQQLQLKLDGLNIEDDFYPSLCSISQALDAEPGKPYQGGIDHGTYNLLRGKAAPMLEILKTQGIDVDSPLKDIAIASQFEVVVDIPIIDTVGAADSSEILLAA